MSLENFRGFRGQTIVPLAPLTFLVGPNSSGKSSILNALYLCAQSRLGPLAASAATFRGALCDLGAFGDCVNGHRQARSIRISVTQRVRQSTVAPERIDDDLLEVESTFILKRLASGSFTTTVESRSRIPSLLGVRSKRSTKGVLSWELFSDRQNVQGAQHSRFLTRVNPEADEEGLYYLPELAARTAINTFAKENPGLADELRFALNVHKRTMRAGATPLNRIERVTSARTGPLRFYGTESQSASRPIALHDRVEPSSIPSSTQKKGTRYRPSAIERALKKLGIADRISVSALTDYHNALEVRDSVTKVKSNLMDVGFGAATVLPVLIAAFSSQGGPLGLEQPEIHLHPKGQLELGALLCEASAERQLIVETHSEHVVNAARLAVAQRRLHPEDVSILYVDRDKTGSHVTPIGLDSQGAFTSEWPAGFFEERYNTTMRILDARELMSDGATAS